MKNYVFWYHYNKPLSKKYNTPKLTVHFKNKCNIVDHVICNVPTRTKHNKNQPRVVIAGESNDLIIRKYKTTRVAFIN